MLKITKNPTLYLSLIFLLTALATQFYIWSFDLNYVIAAKGWSAIDYINHLTLSGNFKNDYPSGIAELNSSLYMRFLYLLHLVGIPTNSIPYLDLALDIITLSIACSLCLKVLRPKATFDVYVALVILTIGSAARNCDLGNWSSTFIIGTPYFAAELFRLAGICALLHYRKYVAAALLAISVMIHPTMGLIACCFALASCIPQWKRFLDGQTFIASIVFLAACAWWVLPILTHISSSESVPVTQWLLFTKIMNFHWYPIGAGIFSTMGSTHFLPFISFMLLFIHYLSKEYNEEIDIRIFYGTVFLLFLVCLGNLFSLIQHPFLIKLALQRSSGLILIIGLPYIVYGLIQDIKKSKPLLSFAIASTIVPPFFSFGGFAFIPAVVVTLLSGSGSQPFLRKIYLSLLTIGIATIAIYLSKNFVGSISDDSIFGLNQLFSDYRSIKLPLTILLLYSIFNYGEKPYASILFISCLLLFSCIHGYYSVVSPRKAEQTKNADYYSLQMWANQNTPVDSLFMVPPDIYSGWRDYSKRSTFGNLHEWLQNGWMYNSSKKNFDEGIKRFNEFKVELKQYTDISNITAFAPLSKEMHQRYYSASNDWFIGLSKKYKIDYFVFDREFKSTPDCNIVYQNTSYYICSFKKSN